MGLISSIENVDLALQAQTAMQRKVLDHQAQNFLILLKGVTEQTEKISGGRDGSLGKVVDEFAWQP